MPVATFGDPLAWPDDDLVAVSRGFDPDTVVSAYRQGLFPMPGPWGSVRWFSPVERAVLPLDGLRVTRSLRQSARHFEVRMDTAFERVVLACGDPTRPGGWIDRGVVEVYTELHRRGVAHSVEAWTADGRLAGGLYGVAIGGLFAGESMFHDADVGRDASKVALLALVQRLRAAGADRLLDVQWQTTHLASLGVVEIGRAAYLERLAPALTLPDIDWA